VTPLEKKRYFRPDEVALMLNVSIRTVQVWAKDGKIPAIKIGGVVRIPVAELEKAIVTMRW
jgi:excisionase family DNA binding protein